MFIVNELFWFPTELKLTLITYCLLSTPCPPLSGFHSQINLDKSVSGNEGGVKGLANIWLMEEEQADQSISNEIDGNRIRNAGLEKGVINISLGTDQLL